MGGGAGSNLSILKEDKKIIGGQFIFFLGVGVHLLVPLETYTSYDFPCQESLSSPPLWMILFLWLLLGCNQYWSGLVYVFPFNIPGAPDCQAQLAFFLGLKPLGTRGLGFKYDPTDKENNSLLVYVEWASRVNFVTMFVDLYQNKLWVICNNLIQFAYLSSASGPSNDVIKMAAIVLHMYTYKTSYLKQ